MFFLSLIFLIQFSVPHHSFLQASPFAKSHFLSTLGATWWMAPVEPEWHGTLGHLLFWRLLSQRWLAGRGDNAYSWHCMRVYVCDHLEWIITPREASASTKREDRSACAFIRKDIVGWCFNWLLHVSVAFVIITFGSCSTLTLQWENPYCPFMQSDSFCSWGSCHWNYCRLTQNPQKLLSITTNQWLAAERKRKEKKNTLISPWQLNRWIVCS